MFNRLEKTTQDNLKKILEMGDGKQSVGEGQLFGSGTLGQFAGMLFEESMLKNKELRFKELHEVATTFKSIYGNLEKGGLQRVEANSSRETWMRLLGATLAKQLKAIEGALDEQSNDPLFIKYKKLFDIMDETNEAVLDLNERFRNEILRDPRFGSEITEGISEVDRNLDSARKFLQEEIGKYKTLRPFLVKLESRYLKMEKLDEEIKELKAIEYSAESDSIGGSKASMRIKQEEREALNAQMKKAESEVYKALVYLIEIAPKFDYNVEGTKSGTFSGLVNNPQTILQNQELFAQKLMELNVKIGAGAIGFKDEKEKRKIATSAESLLNDKSLEGVILRIKDSREIADKVVALDKEIEAMKVQIGRDMVKIRDRENAIVKKKSEIVTLKESAERIKMEIEGYVLVAYGAEIKFQGDSMIAINTHEKSIRRF
ncbi:MAG: hypothetical protein KGH65_00830 [Candidatus Micrarchaeota archaeon]|nr:hypothetical protein [Candidatus Micrarchaeota archaeon]